MTAAQFRPGLPGPQKSLAIGFDAQYPPAKQLHPTNTDTIQGLQAMPGLSTISARLKKLFGCLAVVLCFLPMPAVPPAHAQSENLDYSTLTDELDNLSPEALEELLVFVAGNVLFTLYHESGHMLISELGLPVLAQEEDAVDNLATVSMLADDTEDTDLLLTNAMVGWFLIAEENHESLRFHDEHGLDQQRGYRMLCLMVGADEEAFRDLAVDLDMPQERIETCAYEYEQVADTWVIATEPYLRDGDTPAGKIKAVHHPAPEGLETLSLFLEETGLLEEVADKIDTLFALPQEVTFRAAACGEENAFWDPDTREIVLCHELLAGLAKIYLDVLADGR